MQVGVDWERIGWLAVSNYGGHWSWRLFPRFNELLESTQAVLVLAADVPIGLPAPGRPGGHAAVRNEPSDPRPLAILREVDAVLTPEVQEKVREGHPELSFLHLAGPALVRTSKRDRRGLLRRNEVLAEAFGPAWQALFLEVPLPPAKKRDLVDAGALLWTAQRIARGEARYVPEPPDEGARGLRMAIYF